MVPNHDCVPGLERPVTLSEYAKLEGLREAASFSSSTPAVKAENQSLKPHLLRALQTLHRRGEMSERLLQRVKRHLPLDNAEKATHEQSEETQCDSEVERLTPLKKPGLYIAWLVAAVMLVFAVTSRHPYSFYTLLRWICCAAFAYSAFAAYEKNRVPWAWIFAVLAVLYNPVFHVHLDRSTWIGVNWLTIGVIAVASVVFWRKSLREDRSDAGSETPSESPYKKHPAEEFLRETKVARATLLARMPRMISIPGIETVRLKDQPSQKENYIGRTRRTFAAIRGFVDRHLTTKTVVVFTILLLLASWIYPPWIVGSYRNVLHGWCFVFDTTRATAMRVDFGRLFLIDAIIAATGGLIAWTVSENSGARHMAVRLVFYALLGASFAALLGFATASAILIGNVARHANHKPRIDFVPDEYLAAKSAVSADDLHKITLFDVEPGLSFGDSSHVSAFHGRVRNDLPRAIEKIGLKASFYNSAGQLIEVRTFLMLDPDWQNSSTMFPNSPLTFHGRVDVENLPVGWRYLLEVIEAHYVQYLSTDPNAGK
jgi:hypothetical protein